MASFRLFWFSTSNKYTGCIARVIISLTIGGRTGAESAAT